MKVAVLMTCYNRVETTLRCLRSLFAQSLAQPPNRTISNQTILDVWLVDDASPDGTGEKVKAAFPQVHVIQSPGGLYWCRGMRLAWDCAAQQADYDFYLWLNDDVFLSDGALETAFADYESLAGVSLRVMTGAFYETVDGKRRVGYVTRGADGRFLVPNGVCPQEGHGWFGGNFVLVPREVYKTVGPISRLYHHNYGDGDYAYRLAKAGIPYYAPSRVLGECQGFNVRVRALGDIRLAKRIALLWDPKGFHLGDAFVYSFLHKGGVLRAFASVAHIALKVLLAQGSVRGG